MSLQFPSFQSLESFSFPVTVPIHRRDLVPPLLFTTQRDNEDFQTANGHEPPSTNSSVQSSCLVGSPCHFCKGKKYGFTAYFHNHAIFPEPPHDILHLVEESYVLRDRLKSLLITYTMRRVEYEEVETVMGHIHTWDFAVGALTDEVMSSASNSGFVLHLAPLDDVRKWKDAIVNELRYYVSGQTQIKLPKERLTTLMFEYRKVWEATWIGYMHDRRMMQSELDGTPFSTCM